MKYILSLIISGALVVSGFGQTRNVLVGTNNAVVQPTNFWSADAVNARTGLGLGTAATNPVTAFQPSSLVLSNLASSDGGGLTNLNVTNIVGILGVAQGGTGSTNAADARTALGLGTAATNPATAFQSSSTTLSNLATANGGSLTNLQATSLVGVVPSSNIPSFAFTNLSGTLSVAQGGTGATNAAIARQNLGSTTVGDALFISSDALTARTTIGALATNGNGAGLTNLTAANIIGTVALASNLSSPLSLTNGGTGATNAASARTSLGLGNTNTVFFNRMHVIGGSASGFFSPNILQIGDVAGFLSNAINFYAPITFGLSNEVIAQTRTNLGLPWSGLTNTNAATFQASLFGANTNPVLVNTSGSVVSPTNFWQAAPITTTFIESQPATNSSTNISAARYLHIHSLSTNIVNVTNTINLPTNGATFDGDIALVVHQGPTNSMTRVRTAGSTNDLVTMTRFDEAVEFVYYENVWQFNHNFSYIEPIYFSGTNAAANAAASRTNLGLGGTNTVEFGEVFTSYIEVTDGSNTVDILPEGIGFAGGAAGFTRTNLGLGATNTVQFQSVEVLAGTNASILVQDQGTIEGDGDLYITAGALIFATPIEFNNSTNAATTRTNLGLPLAALTNTSNTNFQAAVFTTNAAPTNTANVNGVGFNTTVGWMSVTLNIGGTNQVFRIPLFQ